jgi:hypothetical protein
VPVELPNGAALNSMCGYLYDNDGANDATVSLYKYTYNIVTNGNSATLLAAVATSGSPGYYNACSTVTPTETILHNTGNLRNSYVAIAWMPTSSAVQFRAIRLDWWRQISPAPATSSFGDVQALAASGITAGCGSGNFCPEQYVKRSEMAVYLAKALGLHWAQ